MIERQIERLIINTDGSSRGNPGPGGIGIVIREATEKGPILVEEIWEGLHHTTNNKAEYSALIRAMKRALELGCNDVEIRCDSLLVVNQVSGKWATGQVDLMLLRDEAVKLSKEFGKFTITHIYGTENLDADRLAKKASGTTRDRFPASRPVYNR